MTEQLAWGIVGTGGIAKRFASGLARSRTGVLAAVGSRTQAAADAFGEQFAVPRRHGSYAALLADPAVQAVYIATPHPPHARLAIEAAEAGKHVLCEKPIAMNHPEAMAIVEAAHRHDVFLMEAFMYRCHPQTARLVELIRAGAIGDVRAVQTTFSFRGSHDPRSRMLAPELGGGGILDVGGYCASMAQLVAGAALGLKEGFAEPVEVLGAGHVGETGVDEYAAATLRFPGDIVAQLLCGVRLRADSVVRVLGTEGSLTLTDPWTPGERTTISVARPEGAVEQIEVAFDGHLYGAEADAVAAGIPARQAPEMSWEDTLANMRTLDAWRAAVGVEYPTEHPEGPGQDRPVHGRPITVRQDAPMRYGRIEGVDKRISRLVLGVDNQNTWPRTAVMLDDFYERGGTCFDTAFIYHAGACERMLGAWIKNRDLRDQVVILDKGAHTPFCTPEDMARQLATSLERLQTDYVDIYMLHRDNPQVPVGEFISALNDQRRAGRVRVFGASNWSLERVEEANAWAAAHDLQGFSAVSNNFSLARMVEPVWAGCIAASDPDSRAWLTRTQLPLMPWSSQARGFFVPGRGDPDNRSDPELVRCWYREDNFQRRARAVELAKARGVLPIDIALAYVLAQPFPTFPLIGPRRLQETRTSFQALGVELTPREVRWLDLDGDR